jgi:hypothetical protein
MNTPPIAGVTTKYWYMKTVTMPRMSVRPSGRTTTNATVVASVNATGIQSALFRTSWGNARRSERRSSGRNAARKELPTLGRAGAGGSLERAGVGARVTGSSVTSSTCPASDCSLR